MASVDRTDARTFEISYMSSSLSSKPIANQKSLALQHILISHESVRCQVDEDVALGFS
jgi:hypothetical protein